MGDLSDEQKESFQQDQVSSSIKAMEHKVEYTSCALSGISLRKSPNAKVPGASHCLNKIYKCFI